jgi:hypothetical protein
MYNNNTQKTPHVYNENVLFTGAMDASIIANMDRDALKKQIDNMQYQASMERWPLSKSIQA